MYHDKALGVNLNKRKPEYIIRKRFYTIIIFRTDYSYIMWYIGDKEKSSKTITKKYIAQAHSRQYCFLSS